MALPVCHYPGQIFVIESPEQEEPALALLDGETILGFDTETKPAFVKVKFYL